MSFVDHHDIFLGSTDDGWTFVALNRPIPNATRILTGIGFTVRIHQGRPLFLLPPEAAPDAHELAGIAAYGLMAHTPDLVDLAWTTRQPPTTMSEATIRLTDQTVTATAATDRAGAVLTQYCFTPASAPRQYELPGTLSERAMLSAVVRAEAHLYADGIAVHVDLDIATIQDIPPRPNSATPVPPSADRAPRRSR